MALNLTSLAEAGVDEKTLCLVEELVQQEKERRQKVQKEGIAAARARGVRFGRPAIQPPPDFADIVKEWENKQLTVETALRLCKMSQSTFFRKVRELRQAENWADT